MALIPNPLPKHSTPADRDFVIDWARNLLAERNFVILDTETTGPANNDEVVQIGIIDADGNGLLDSLVKPERARKMPPKAQEVHGISMEMLNDAPTFSELFPKFKNAVGEKWVVCYNDAFDMRLIEQTASMYKFDERGLKLDLRSKCAMMAYSQFVGAAGKYGDYAWQKLPRRESKDHQALDDCILTLELIKEIAQSPLQAEMLTVTIADVCETVEKLEHETTKQPEQLSLFASLSA